MADPHPDTVGRKRVLGVVPGTPPTGVRKDPEEQRLVAVWPHLLVRHAVAALVVLLLVLVVSLLFNAPLAEVANPLVTPNPEKAPWYFAALQELLSHFDPAVAGVLVPVAIALGLAAIPYIDHNTALKPSYRKLAVAIYTVFLVAWIVLTIIGFAFRGPNWSWTWPWDEWHGEL